MVSGNFMERTGHPAQYPEKLIERIIKASTNSGDVVLDPFIGSGTTAIAALKADRKYIGFDNDPEYVKRAGERIAPFKLQTS